MEISRNLIKMVYDSKKLGIDLCLATDKHNFEYDLPLNLRVIDTDTVDVYNCEIDMKWWVVFRPELTLEDELYHLKNKKYCKCSEKDLDEILFEECTCNIPTNEELKEEIYQNALKSMNVRIETLKNKSIK